MFVFLYIRPSWISPQNTFFQTSWITLGFVKTPFLFVNKVTEKISFQPHIPIFMKILIIRNVLNLQKKKKTLRAYYMHKPIYSAQLSFIYMRIQL